MTAKTRGIVLHYIRYGDNGLVVNCYTNDFGRQDYLVNSIRNKRSGFRLNLFQPLTLLEMEVNIKETRGLQRLKEVNPSPQLHNIAQNAVKGSIALFLAEIIYKSIREEKSNPELFSFLESSVHYLENSDNGFINFHPWFLVEFTRFLGFHPSDNFSDKNIFFDMENGNFNSVRRVQSVCLTKEKSNIIHELLSSGPEVLDNISITNHVLRNELLENILEYYRLHNDAITNIKSLQILREVFM